MLAYTELRGCSSAATSPGVNLHVFVRITNGTDPDQTPLSRPLNKTQIYLHPLYDPLYVPRNRVDEDLYVCVCVFFIKN